MNTIQEFRKYRVQLSEPYFNQNSRGIALFDTTITFLTAYILDYYFNLSSNLPGKNKQQSYYLLVIPFGIIIHHLVLYFKQSPGEITFLNKQIFSTEINIYKLIVIIMLYIVYTNIYQ